MALIDGHPRKNKSVNYRDEASKLKISELTHCGLLTFREMLRTGLFQASISAGMIVPLCFSRFLTPKFQGTTRTLDQPRPSQTKSKSAFTR
jgi:hypothetical protein